MVKIRGRLVELGEVETALRALPQVQHAVVDAVPDGADHRLIAFCTLAEGCDEAAAKAACAQVLPPALVLATAPIATVSRVMRTQVLEVTRQDYVRTARAKGVSELGVYFFHALRNALIPLATILGPTLTGLIGGAVITETVWSWPGLGRLFVNANFSRDYPVILAGFVIGAVGVIIGNLFSDVLYGVIDPRVRLK